MDNHTPPPAEPRSSIRAAASRRWTALNAKGGWIHQRRKDLVDALDGDWDNAESWVKATAWTITVIAAIFAVGTIGGALLKLATALIAQVRLTDVATEHNGIAATITGPVHAYLADHTTGLPLDPATAYTVWKTVGLLAALLGFAAQATVARLTWTAWTGTTLLMIWQTTPEPSRTVAVGLAAALLAGASLFALRGISFSLRPQVFTRNDVNPQITLCLPDPESQTTAAIARAGVPNPLNPWHDQP